MAQNTICNIDPKSFRNGICPPLFKDNLGRTWKYSHPDDKGLCCYVLVGINPRRRSSIPTPPPTPCAVPTVILVNNLLKEIVLGAPVNLTANETLFSPVTGGVPPYSYALSKDAGATFTPFGTDPNLVFVTFTCADFFLSENYTIVLRVASNCPPINSFTDTSVLMILQNNDGSCII